MSSYLSLHTCWLPRTVLFQRIFLLSTFSTKSISNNTSSHRSTSRFSLKIARFLFLKRRIKCEHHAKNEPNKDMHLLARSFLFSLEPEHRKILHDELIHVEKLSTTTTTSIEIRPSQLAGVFLETGLPYIGFGFVDNFVMLIALLCVFLQWQVIKQESKTKKVSYTFLFKAAGFGNAVSDVMGISLADHIERTCGRFLALFGIDLPKLTKAQWGLRSVHVTQFFAKVICIFFGCVLGNGC
ncbi:unnamed protein product [Rotaria sp. Silwood2]|nr:unnamed protein product [Rotaria sp. Silwood2]